MRTSSACSSRDVILIGDPGVRENPSPPHRFCDRGDFQNLTKTRHIIVEPDEIRSFQRFITAFDRYADAVREIIDTASAGKSDRANVLFRSNVPDQPGRMRFVAQVLSKILRASWRNGSIFERNSTFALSLFPAEAVSMISRTASA